VSTASDAYRRAWTAVVSQNTNGANNKTIRMNLILIVLK